MTETAAVVITITGSIKLDKNGSDGILPFVNGNDSDSKSLIVPTAIVSADENENGKNFMLFPDKV